MVRIRDGRLERIDAPEGIFQPDPADPGSWEQSAREAPRLAGGEASAVRAYEGTEGAERLLGTDTPVARSAPTSGCPRSRA